MNDETNFDDSKEPTQKEMLERAKQLLTLTDLVDSYPAVVERRITGMIFILIGGGVSLATLFFTSLLSAYPELGTDLFVVLVFVIGSLAISGLVIFRLINPLTQSYSSVARSTGEGMSTGVKVTWGILVIAIIIFAIYSFGTDQGQLFPIFIQIVLTIGNTGIYLDMRKEPRSSDVAFAHLILVTLMGFSILPIIFLTPIAFPIMILVDIGGLYGIGIYTLLTAERLLVQTMGSD
ncbi:MAG: hypothetical protein ACFFF4_02245 [Candidatus Thorarchaeota archaeon]